MRISDWSSDVCSSDLLSARDYAKDFEAIAARTYDSSSAGIDDIKAALARNSEANAQALQDAYDDDTKHDPTGFKTEQAKWAAAVIGARTSGTRLRDVLKARSEEHTSELQSLMRISYAVFCLKKKKQKTTKLNTPIL